MTGFEHFPAFATDQEQFELTAALRKAVAVAPFFTPRMRSGLPYSMITTNAGRYGFAGSDGTRRYLSVHPETGLSWPAIPDVALRLGQRAAGETFQPDNAEISFFSHPADAEGIHRDMDEECRDAPLVMIALGDTTLFRLGGKKRADPVRHHIFRTGDVILLGGEARDFWHGFGEIHPQSCRLPLFRNGGRICMTLRRVMRNAHDDRVCHAERSSFDRRSEIPIFEGRERARESVLADQG